MKCSVQPSSWLNGGAYIVHYYSSVDYCVDYIVDYIAVHYYSVGYYIVDLYCTSL